MWRFHLVRVCCIDGAAGQARRTGLAEGTVSRCGSLATVSSDPEPLSSEARLASGGGSDWDPALLQFNRRQLLGSSAMVLLALSEGAARGAIVKSGLPWKPG